MDCMTSRSLLSAYLDGALADNERSRLGEHAAVCASCRARLESLRAIKHAVARLPDREEPPRAVRVHIEALRFGQPKRGAWRAAALAAVAALALVVVAASLMRGRNGAARLADDLVVDHLHSVPEVKAAEIASSDRAEAARFFANHVPFNAVVPNLPGTELLGGRLCQLRGRRVELLFYRRENRTLSLFIADRPVADPGCWAARGHHVCSRSRADLTLLLVGELPADELRRLLDESTF